MRFTGLRRTTIRHFEEGPGIERGVKRDLTNALTCKFTEFLERETLKARGTHVRKEQLPLK